jgi:Protein of unknown function (DUF3089)
VDIDLLDLARRFSQLPWPRASLAHALAVTIVACCGSAEVRAQPASPDATAAPANYSDPALWLCRPGRVDACATNLDATIIAEDGSTTHEAYHADPQAPIDCFYVYPTVSHQPKGNADFAIDLDVATAAIQQFARFGSRCRLFAPVYRQVTVPALVALFSGKPMPLSRELPYADVLAAWRNYLANDNHGRGFVLIGHSQGAGVLIHLIRDEIDGKPIQAQMVSALLLGAGGDALTVKSGAEPPLAFPHITVCRTKSEIGCVIAYSSFRAESPPEPGTLFEKAPEGAHHICANPAALEGDPAPLDAYLSASGALVDFPTPKQPMVWTNPARAIDTPFVKVPGLLTAKCVESGQVVYLAVSRNPSPDGRRVSDISGDLISSATGKAAPDWGLHLIDLNLAMGDLLSIVGEETHAYLAHPGRQ